MTNSSEHICGGHSIHYQIIRYANKRNEVRLLKDAKYIEKVRQALLKAYPKKFCDYKSNYHVDIGSSEASTAPLPQTIESIFLKNKKS